MKAIDKKMLRELRGMWGQAIAIAFVIIAGVATYVGMISVMESLQHSLDRYYEEYRFAEGFAQVRRAPNALADRLANVEGISEIETRVTSTANVEIEGFDEPVTGLLVSIPEDSQPDLNQLVIRDGRLIRRGYEEEVLINEPFAEAHGLGPGDQFSATISGRQRMLTIVGVALSPEYLLQVQPGSIFPDTERFGVIWIGREALAAATDLSGAFNDLSFTLAPGTHIEDVLDRLDLILEEYGSQGAIARADQPSHYLMEQELIGLEGIAAVLPVIFLLVAAFLLNIVITRLINLQRELIAILKAFGYTNLTIGLHYVKLVLVIAVIGCAFGTLLGIWFGKAMGDLYLTQYRFPQLDYLLRIEIIFTATLLTTGAALVGVVMSIRRAVQLPPAEAMRPPPPAKYSQTLVERLGLRRFFDQPTRMIFRNLERQWIKAAMAIIGISASCAILILGLFFVDSFEHIIDVQFGIAQQEDVTVTFIQPTSTDAIHEIRSIPGVLHAEALRTVPVRLRHEHRTDQIGIEGVSQNAYLRNIINADLESIVIPQSGLVLSAGLGERLHAPPGTMIRVEILEGNRRQWDVPVMAWTEQFIGSGAYMDIDALNRLTGEGQAVSGALLMIDEHYEASITEALQDRPRVASIASQDRIVQAFWESSAQSMLTMTFFLSLFAGVIAFGVIYNSLRIALSERERELASMRVLGFTKGEISYILLGEQALLTLLAIPIGFILGTWGAHGLAQTFETDLYSLPVVISRYTYTVAAITVLVAAIASALMIRRRINRLDLIGVLKTRE